MPITVLSTPITQVAADWIIVGQFEDEAPLGALDQALGGALVRLKEQGDLTGKFAECLAVPVVTGIAARRLLLIGLGKKAALTHPRWLRACQTAVRSITTKAGKSAAVLLPIESREFAREAAVAMVVGGAGQDLYKAERSRFPLAEGMVVVGNSNNDITSGTQAGNIIGEAVNLTRELVNRAPEDIYPASFAERAKQLAAELGGTLRVFDEQELKQERMGSMLAVGQGSSRPPRMVVWEYVGKPDAPLIALCGKGVTFDSGGLSLKTNDQMIDMKCDMAGAATVLGAMSAIIQLKLPVRVVGLMGLVENMPSGASFKLGDVLKARNGVTIEVLNTDAEGRLVLADVLSYAVDHGAEYLVDLATLTGSCVIALGDDVAGVFANHCAWGARIEEVAKGTGEDVWRMPMFDEYAELIKSDVADVKNVGGRPGGSITAAKFLEKFVSGKPWAHIDIAGPAFASSAKPHRDGGATGYFVRSLIELVTRLPG